LKLKIKKSSSSTSNIRSAVFLNLKLLYKKQEDLDGADSKNLLIDLYKKLNSGILAGFENKELSIYLPHVTLGVFESNEEMNEALAKLREQNLSYLIEVDAINLLTLNSDDSVKEIKVFKLPK